MEIGAQRRLERKARSRSDAPRLIVAFGTALTIIGGIDRITTGTVVGIGSTMAIVSDSITSGTGVRITTGIVGGADGTLSSHWPTR